MLSHRSKRRSLLVAFAGPAMIVNHWLNNGLPQISSAVTAHANVRSLRMSSRGFPWRATFTILDCALRLADISSLRRVGSWSNHYLTESRPCPPA